MAWAQMGTKMLRNLLPKASELQYFRGDSRKFRGHKWAHAAGRDCYFLPFSSLINSRTTFV